MNWNDFVRWFNRDFGRAFKHRTALITAAVTGKIDVSNQTNTIKP